MWSLNYFNVQNTNFFCGQVQKVELHQLVAWIFWQGQDQYLGEVLKFLT